MEQIEKDSESYIPLKLITKEWLEKAREDLDVVIESINFLNNYYRISMLIIR